MKAAGTLLEGIFAFIATGLSNGRIEGLNDKIRTITRRAYGEDLIERHRHERSWLTRRHRATLIFNPNFRCRGRERRRPACDALAQVVELNQVDSMRGTGLACLLGETCL